MSNIIHKLPNNIANQIAAGEVIQRPASAIKELLENAIDADATEIETVILNAGKTLVQVSDNGKGMSPEDAKIAFERHATSKLTKIEDLYRIKTMGFRGEALASIASVSQVELKTRQREDEVGTRIEINNGNITKEEACACVPGTTIGMKNLFFNIPARKNFLKTDSTEMRHLVEEFIRVALAFPKIFFSLTHNGQQLFHLEKGNLKQRIVQILGSNYQSKLVPVSDETDYMNISGFVGKPEIARKSRGDQYLFVNNRFIKSAYLNHAITHAFEKMIAPDAFPSYVLFIDLDPSQIDINVHPTKQEIKFEDEKIIYAFVKAAVKHALGQFSITPSLDFTLNPEIQSMAAVSQPFTPKEENAAKDSSLFQTFSQKNQAHFIESRKDQNAALQHWQDFFSKSENQKKEDLVFPMETPTEILGLNVEAQPNKLTLPEVDENSPIIQIAAAYLIAVAKTGFVIINQQLAHERILYEKYTAATLKSQPIATQKTMFPSEIECSLPEAMLLKDLMEDLRVTGYEIQQKDETHFYIMGNPADLEGGNEKQTIELLIEQYQHFPQDIHFSRREKIVRCLSRQHAVKAGQVLSQEEMKRIVGDLLNCKTPNITPEGNPTYIEFKENYLDQLFKN